uniref:Uncharacterized protein n=1 Tax=Cyanothece sp. (strain PCC 7425 / ATCC 29141) TaxID=395961 RepID=B8HU19_CYAP4
MQFLLESLGVLFLFLIAGIALAILLLITILLLLFRSLPVINALNEEISSYIEQIVRKITADWDLQQLTQEATPKLGELLQPTQMSAYSEQCAQELGQLTGYGVAKGSIQGLPALKFLQPLMKLFAKKADLEASKNLLMAEFVSASEFEKGMAQFEFQLLNRGEGWLVNSLSITVTTPTASQPNVLSLGEKTTMADLVEENKKTLNLEKMFLKAD